MNRLMIRHTMDKPLPYDAEVEYLESSGTQYIVTDYIDNRNDVIIEIECAALGYSSTHNIFGMRANGTMQTSTSQILLQMSAYTTGYAYITTGKDYADPQLVGQKNTSMQDLDNLTMYSQRTPTGKNLVLFAFDNIGTILCYPCRIKRMQIRVSGGTILADYISVRKGNTGYMYNKVSGQLFGNQGTGDFVVGPDYNPFEHQYLTFIPVEDAVFSWAERATSGHLEYSVNGGQTWVTIVNGESTPTIAAGNKVIWRGDLKPAYSTSSIPTTAGIGTFSASGNYHAYGNTMSLLFYDNYYGSQLNSDDYRAAFGALFYQDAHILTAPLLPATTLADYCYNQMFRGCSNLVTAVRVLSAMRISSRACQGMYYDCTNLRVASILLCDVIGSYAVQNMYRNCSNIDYIKCLATQIGPNGTATWVYGVSSTGTFVKAVGMTGWSTGASGIPEGWTVVDDNS